VMKKWRLVVFLSPSLPSISKTRENNYVNLRTGFRGPPALPQIWPLSAVKLIRYSGGSSGFGARGARFLAVCQPLFEDSLDQVEAPAPLSPASGFYDARNSRHNRSYA
jgi:hypothetical protein